MRYIFNIVFLLAFSLNVAGQSAVSSQEQQKVLQKFNAASASLKSMQCSFVQTKKMKLLRNEMQSKGVMFFVRPDKLRWQYDTPYRYTFVLNGNEVRI